MNEIHETNRRYSDRTSDEWRRLREEDGLLSRLSTEPELAFDGGLLEEIRDSIGNLRGKDVCVIGSGDNYVSFALAGLGARVVSSDISQDQLDIAAVRSTELGLQIEFVRADAADLGGFRNESFDLVVSSNGFFVWLSDLDAVYTSVHRVLRPGGHYIFYDIHPFNRPWDGTGASLVMKKTYWETGPFVEDGGTRVSFNWTIADLLNPMASAGLSLVRLRESKSVRHWTGPSYKEPEKDDALSDWRQNALAGLPMWITVNSRKAR